MHFLHFLFLFRRLREEDRKWFSFTNIFSTSCCFYIKKPERELRTRLNVYKPRCWGFDMIILSISDQSAEERRTFHKVMASHVLRDKPTRDCLLLRDTASRAWSVITAACYNKHSLITPCLVLLCGTSLSLHHLTSQPLPADLIVVVHHCTTQTHIHNAMKLPL